MYVYLRPSPSTTRRRAGSIHQHGQPWTIVLNTEKQKSIGTILPTPVLTTALDEPGCGWNQRPGTRAQPGRDASGGQPWTSVVFLVMRRSGVRFPKAARYICRSEAYFLASGGLRTRGRGTSDP